MLNNHVAITILYHEEPLAYTGIRVIGFEVKAESIQHSTEFDEKQEDEYPPTCTKTPPSPMILEKDKETTVLFTYSVHWEVSSLPFAKNFQY